METITEQEVLDELSKYFASEVSQEGATAEEIAEVTGLNRATVNKKMKPLIKAGKVRVTRVERMNILGMRVKIPAYVAVSES